MKRDLPLRDQLPRLLGSKYTALRNDGPVWRPADPPMRTMRYLPDLLGLGLHQPKNLHVSYQSWIDIDPDLSKLHLPRSSQMVKFHTNFQLKIFLLPLHCYRALQDTLELAVAILDIVAIAGVDIVPAHPLGFPSPQDLAVHTVEIQHQPQCHHSHPVLLRR